MIFPGQSGRGHCGEPALAGDSKTMAWEFNSPGRHVTTSEIETLTDDQLFAEFEAAADGVRATTRTYGNYARVPGAEHRKVSTRFRTACAETERRGWAL